VRYELDGETKVGQLPDRTEPIFNPFLKIVVFSDGTIAEDKITVESERGEAQGWVIIAILGACLILWVFAREHIPDRLRRKRR
jgi:hypothetical protein